VKVCWLLIGDGRDELHERSRESAREMLPAPADVVIVDDSDHTRGFAGALAEGWARVAETGCDYVFHLELDFVLLEPVPIARMIGLLERRPYLAQLSLLRQAWNDREKAAGGIIPADPDQFHQRTDRGDVWIEQRKYWTTNPALYSAGFCVQGWPVVEHSEGVFTHRLLDDPDVQFGIWGAKADAPRVEHIGIDRAGHGY
jgi:hypothetical protein